MESAKAWYQRWWVWILVVLFLPIALTIIGVWYVLKTERLSSLSKVLFSGVIILIGGLATLGVYGAGSEPPRTQSPVESESSASSKTRESKEPPEETPSPQASSKKQEETSAQKKEQGEEPSATEPERSSASSEQNQSSKPADSSPQKEEQTEESANQPESETGRKATVVSVVDGDTYKVRFSDGTNDTVRMLGVDTPETFNDNKRGEYGAITDVSCLRRWGKKATTYVKRQINGQRVTLTFDVQAGRRGRYGRLLVYTQIDGEFLGDRLLREGYARVYVNETFAQRPSFLAIQKKAQKKNVGLWACGTGGSHSSGQPKEETSSKPQENVNEQDTADIDYSRYTCETNSYSCSGFEKHDVIQGIYEHCGGPKTDVHNLDGDGDGVACETLRGR